MSQPETRFASAGDVNIAYQVLGEGRVDLVWAWGLTSNIEVVWEEPSYAAFLRGLAEFARVILFDRRGCGASDRHGGTVTATLEERMADVLAVLDAVGSERSSVFGVSEGGNLAALLAATYPSRIASIVVYGTVARFLNDQEHPWGWADADWLAAFHERVRAGWGTVESSAMAVQLWAPSLAGDERFIAWMAKHARQSCSRSVILPLMRAYEAYDLIDVFPAVRVPTLVLHRTGDALVPVAHGRWIAEHIPEARLVELPGIDHLPFVGDAEARARRDRGFPGRVTGGIGNPAPAGQLLVTDVVQAPMSSMTTPGERSLADPRPDRRQPPRPIHRASGQTPRQRHACHFRRAGACRSAARSASSTPQRASGSTYASGSTPASARSTTPTSAGLPSTSPPGSPSTPPPGRSWCRAPCATSSPARASASASPGPSSSTPSSADRDVLPVLSHGVTPDAARRLAIEQANVLRRDGEYWTVAYDGHVAMLRDTKGVRDLANLLAAPHRELHVLDLGAEGIGGRAVDAREATDAAGIHRERASGESVLDDQARIEYKRRIHELQADIDDADGRGDPDGSARARQELDALVDQLTAAYGLGGQPRRTPDRIERARKTVTRRIRDAIARTERAHPPLGRHLQASIRTGVFCSYAPERDVRWTVEAHR